MLINTKLLRSGEVIESEICIIGGGVAGITLALEFDRAGISVSLLESGGVGRDGATSDLYHGTSSGIPYDFGDGTRSRFLGGSSNCWGGFCRPWDKEAFQYRDWVNASGWPFGLTELQPYYRRAHTVLAVPSAGYRPENWVRSSWEEGATGPVSSSAPPYRLPVDPENVEEIVSHFSPPLKLGHAYRAELKQSRNVSVYLWANVTEIESDATASKVESVRVRTLSGIDVRFKARIFVLAAGGIENPRLLLESHRQEPNGLGNRYGLVGRYFQDHPRIFSGKVDFVEPLRHNPLYDIKFHCIAEYLTIAGSRISGQLRLPFEVQRKERLLDAQVWFRSLYAGEGEELVRAMYRLRQRMRGRRSMGPGLVADLKQLMARPADALTYSIAHSSGSRGLVRSVTMEMIAETEPNPQSRVLLGDEVDALGMRRVKVDWRMTDASIRTVDRTFELLTKELHDKKIARVVAGPSIASKGWPPDLEGTYHHMGTTRMNKSPRLGVVDPNCRVHGIGNLFVAGSSVFPTSSANHPTMTLVALALRLADRLVDQVKTLRRAPVGQVAQKHPVPQT